VVKDGPTYNFFNILAEKGEAGPPAYVVLKNINYTDQYDALLLNSLAQDIIKLKTSEDPLYTWLSNFN